MRYYDNTDGFLQHVMFDCSGDITTPPLLMISFDRPVMYRYRSEIRVTNTHTTAYPSASNTFLSSVAIDDGRPGAALQMSRRWDFERVRFRSQDSQMHGRSGVVPVLEIVTINIWLNL